MRKEDRMPEVTLILDTTTGTLLVADPDRLPVEARAAVDAFLGPGVELGCARPQTVLPPPVVAAGCAHTSPTIRVTGYYHDSLVEGPGRRSCALLSGCDLGCIGCWVPHLHPADAGRLVCVACLADALLDPVYARDGISLLGGEPFFQPLALWALVQALRVRRCPHLLVYSGYTYERLQQMARDRPAIGAVLGDVEILIDGPFVAKRADQAGPWTGSGNQRVIDLARTRCSDHVMCLEAAG
jgi:anaerobic ribonucleoside-triphosphate reductase activating protein